MVLVHLVSLTLRLAALGLALILWRRVLDYRVGLLSLLPATMVVIEARSLQRGGIVAAASYSPEGVSWMMLFISIILFVTIALLWGVFNRGHSRMARLEATLANLHDGVVRTDAKGRVQDMNPAAEELTGWTLQEAMNQPIDQVIQITTLAEMGDSNPIDLGKVATEGPPKLRGLLRSRIGARVEVELTHTTLEDQDHHRTEFLVVLYDRTHVRKVEEELLRASKLESVGVLAGGIAHDFNNLLTAVSGNVSLAMALLPQDDKALPLLGRIEQAAGRAKALSRQLLTFATGGQPLRKNTSVDEIIQETVTFALAGRAVDCDLAISPKLYATVDRGQLAQVIQNLVINGCEAMDNKGTLRVEATCLLATDQVPGLPTGDFVHVAVTDSGHGISPVVLRRVFEPYFTTKTTGTGLGLAVAHSIIRQHDGRIQITSKEDSGTTVCFWLPASAPPLETKPEAPPPVPQEGVRILLMDDDPIVSEVAEMMLKRLGFSVTTTHDGQEAVSAFGEAQRTGEAFELVLLDLTVPGGMGGLETLKALRSMDPAIRGIGTSGYSGKAALGSLTEHGFVAVLPKPFTLADMRAVMAEALAVPIPPGPSPPGLHESD